MLCRLSLGLLASAISVAALPVIAQEVGSSDVLGVMSISLKDVVKPTLGLQGALQAAGTPNQAGIGGFLPLSVGDNSVWFLDVLVNASFADRDGTSSIVNTNIAATTVSTSTRLGYRWLNADGSWMYGINSGYDSRPLMEGDRDTRTIVSPQCPFCSDKRVFFQQLALNAEAISDSWNFNAYALFPIGDTNQGLDSLYQAGSLDTYGLNIGLFITQVVNASVGYYYQNSDLREADGSGVLGRVAYEMTSGVIAGANISYDKVFDTRVSVDFKVRFGGPKTTSQRKEVQQQPVINAFTSTPANRDLRVHGASGNGNQF